MPDRPKKAPKETKKVAKAKAEAKEARAKVEAKDVLYINSRTGSGALFGSSNAPQNSVTNVVGIPSTMKLDTKSTSSSISDAAKTHSSKPAHTSTSPEINLTILPLLPEDTDTEAAAAPFISVAAPTQGALVQMPPPQAAVKSISPEINLILLPPPLKKKPRSVAVATTTTTVGPMGHLKPHKEAWTLQKAQSDPHKWTLGLLTPHTEALWQIWSDIPQPAPDATKSFLKQWRKDMRETYFAFRKSLEADHSPTPPQINLIINDSGTVPAGSKHPTDAIVTTDESVVSKIAPDEPHQQLFQHTLTIMQTTVSELWSGMLSMSHALQQQHSEFHDIHVQAYSEMCDTKRSYARLIAPEAHDCGPYDKHSQRAIEASMADTDVLFAGFQCQPYLKCGLQLRANDSRAIQPMQTAETVLHIRPHISVWENPAEFFDDDHIHKVYSTAVATLNHVMFVHDTVFVYDSQMGGCLCRQRGWAFMENYEAHQLLPPWLPGADLVAQHKPAKVPQSVPVGSNTIHDDLWINGDYLRCSEQHTLTTDSPTIVGHVWVPSLGSEPDLGVAYILRGRIFVLESIDDDGQCRMMAYDRQAQRENRETVATLRQLHNLTPHRIRYPVYTLLCALLSIRSWGQQPIGNHCLVEGTRNGKPCPRQTTAWEQWCYSHSSWSSNSIADSRAQLRSLGFTEDDVQRSVGASVTSANSDAVATVVRLRRERYLAHLQMTFHGSIPMISIDAPQPHTLAKKVVLFVVTTVPHPAVMISMSGSIPGSWLFDDNRAHEPALSMVKRWSSALTIPTEPLLAGQSTIGDTLIFGVSIPHMGALPKPDAAVWAEPKSLFGDMRTAADLSLGIMGILSGPYQSIHFAGYNTGAKKQTSLSLKQVAVSHNTESFQLRCDKSYLADKMLKAVLMSSKAHKRLSKEMSQFAPLKLPADLPTLSITLPEWAAIVKPISLEDIAPSFQSRDCPMFEDPALADLIYSTAFHPVKTAWLNRKPNQVAPPGLPPRTVADLYLHPEAVMQDRHQVYNSIVADLKTYSRSGASAKRTYKDFRAWSDMNRKPEYRGLIYDNRDPEHLCLLQFDTPIKTAIQSKWIQQWAPDYPDQEFISHTEYGVRWKAEPHHMQFRLPPHLESIKLNLPKLMKQVVKQKDKGMLTLHDDQPFDPSHYVALGTTERKDNPDNPRQTDNRSAPHSDEWDDHGDKVMSFNAESREHTGLPSNPDEVKVTIPEVMVDACVLRHAADAANEPIYAVSHDGEGFFDQLTIAPEELYKNVKVVLPMCPDHQRRGTHVSGQRMGFGGSPNSNIGNRLASLFVVVFHYFMNRLCDPHHETAHPALQTWLHRRKKLNTIAAEQSPSPDWSLKMEYCRQDRLYTAAMFTDDFLSLVIGADNAARAVIALYLASIATGMILAGMQKAKIGTSLTFIGGSIYLMLGITSIPQGKVLRALSRLQEVVTGKCKAKNYEKLAGLLVHCWFLVMMDPALMDHLHDPLTYIKKARSNMEQTIMPDLFPRLRDTVWPAWTSALLHRSSAYFSAALAVDLSLHAGQMMVHLTQDAFRSYVNGAWTAGIGGFLHGYWWYYEVPERFAKWIDITALEFAAIPSGFITLDHILPPASSEVGIEVHCDGLAAVLDTPKKRVKDPAMRFVHNCLKELPEFSSRRDRCSMSHIYGIRNGAGDAASRLDTQRLYLLCASINVRPVRVQTPDRVHQMVELIANNVQSLHEEEHRRTMEYSGDTKRQRSLSELEQALGRSVPNTEEADAVVMVPLRTPPRSKPTTQQPAVQLLYDCQLTPAPCIVTRSPRRTPPSMASTASRVSSCMTHSVVLHPEPSVLLPSHDSSVLTSSGITRTPPPKRERPEPNIAVPVESAAKTRRTSKRTLWHSMHTGPSAEKVASSMLTAYDDMPEYSIRPQNMSAFTALCDTMCDMVEVGVPDGTAANEESAMRLYWKPFCVEMGCDWQRPDYALLNGKQKATEDKLKALCLIYINRHMIGRKTPQADPNSCMNSLRNINRVLNRHADENATLKRAMKILKGMLTLYVREYGPIQPNKALPFPKPVLEKLLSFPTGTKLGKYTLQWDTQVGRSLRAMFEMAAQSGVRLDECTTSRDRDWDLSKMSKASAVWYIKGMYITDPDSKQLRELTTADGLCVTPATSKCDRWGSKHGGKIMYFPYRPDHMYNGCRAMRDLELHFPVRGVARRSTPLFAAAGTEPINASFVRTVLHHMFKHPYMQTVVPQAEAARYSFHSFRKFYCTCLKRAGASVPEILSMCRWSDPASIDGYDMPSHDDHSALIDSAYKYSPDAITPHLLKQVQSLQIDEDQMLTKWCEECHIDLSKDHLDW